MAISRTQTSEVKIFKRSGPEAVLYDLSQTSCVTITLPPGSRWTSQPHWHETHTEYLQILQGRAFVRLGNRTGMYEPGDGVVEVPKYTVHEWHRAALDDQEELVVREWTVPEDGQKEAFFRNLNSFLTEPQPSGMFNTPAVIPRWVRSWLEKWIIPLQLFCIFRTWDNWPLFVGDDSGLFSWAITHVVLGVSSVFGFVLGLRGTYGEYVNEELLARTRGVENTKKTR
ncbi:hypothetical protein H2200_009869 [Cladophialophora chaetospira]|uniref:Cupin type-2 domain-containing protein n=1 Tax=Cladophialophora chaetospira TaxID=386627 RepID=A0AA39CEY8_9EURO|nr:hypothetical protein H2200_009869 [Cladophialophora chaetospira]